MPRSNSATTGRESVDTLSSDVEELLGFLNRHNVRALIVGGHALAFHGQPRYTRDLDIFLEASLSNAERLLGALADVGVGSAGLTADDFTEAGKIIQLGVAPNGVDFMTSIDDVAPTMATCRLSGSTNRSGRRKTSTTSTSTSSHTRWLLTNGWRGRPSHAATAVRGVRAKGPAHFTSARSPIVPASRCTGSPRRA